VKQGDNEAKGGDAEAKGGDGGNADTGNVQKGNGNAYARSETKEEGESPRLAMHPCFCQWSKPYGGDRSSESEADGGDTTAWSGDATGGDGGDGRASGGDADALNNAWVFQSNVRDPRGGGRH